MALFILLAGIDLFSYLIILLAVCISLLRQGQSATQLTSATFANCLGAAIHAKQCIN